MAKIAGVTHITIECCAEHYMRVIDALTTQNIQTNILIDTVQLGSKPMDLSVIKITTVGDNIYLSGELLAFIANLEES